MEIYSSSWIFSLSEFLTLINHFLLAYTISKYEFKIYSRQTILYVIGYIIINFAMFNNASYPVVLLLSLIIDAVIFLSCINVEIKRGIGLYILVIIINTFLDILIEELSKTIMLNDIIPVEYIPIIHRFMSFAVILFIFTIYILLRRKNNIYIFNNYIYLYFHIAISFFTASMILMLVIIYGENLNELFNVFLIATAIFTILANLLITLIYVKKAQENSEIKDEIIIKNDLLELQENYFFDMVTTYSELRKFRHDIKGYITIVNQLIYDNNYDSLLELTNSMDEIVKQNYIINCSNVYIGAVANHFYNICKNNNINFKFDFQLINYVNMKPEHICSLFYNLLNNAVESAVRSKNKEVKITLKSKDKAMLILIENTVDDNFDVNIIKQKSTSKKDYWNHGIGLKNIDSVINYYSGQYDFDYKDGILVSTIILLGVMENYA